MHKNHMKTIYCFVLMNINGKESILYVSGLVLLGGANNCGGGV